MTGWPSIKAKQLKRAMLRAGWRRISTHGGSHQKYVHPTRGRFIFAFHDNATIGGGLLEELAKQLGLKREDL